MDLWLKMFKELQINAMEPNAHVPQSTVGNVQKAILKVLNNIKSKFKDKDSNNTNNTNNNNQNQNNNNVNNNTQNNQTTNINNNNQININNNNNNDQINRAQQQQQQQQDQTKGPSTTRPHSTLRYTTDRMTQMNIVNPNAFQGLFFLHISFFINLYY